MKKKYYLITAFIGIAGLAMFSFSTLHKEYNITPDKKGFAVVELFTSEGCSSCSSADDAIARLLAKKIENVYILSYHVDYWDRLGWKDAYSQAEFTARQQQYANLLSLESTYTPQVIINGSAELVGSDEKKLYKTIEKDLDGPKESSLHINAARHNNTIDVTYTISGNEKTVLNLAIVQPEATTQVKRGENSGKVLHHVNIVRALKTVEAHPTGTLTLEIPKQLIHTPLELIAYIQVKNSFPILGADKKIL